MIFERLHVHKRVLLLGHTGFLGSNLYKLLSEKGYEVIGASKSNGFDLRQIGVLEELMDEHNPQTIINCAAIVGGIEFGRKYPMKIFQDNLQMGLNLITATTGRDLQVINPISNCAYPAEAEIFKEENFWNGPLDDSVLVYGGVRKALWIGSFAIASLGIGTQTNLVFPNMYGPGDHLDPMRAHALGALVYKFVKAEKENESSVTIWGSGKPVREWIYVEDAAKAILASIGVKTDCNIINIGSGETIAISDLAVRIAQEVRYTGDLIFDKSKQDGAPYKSMSTELLSKYLEWQPEVTLTEGISKTIKWYREKLL